MASKVGKPGEKKLISLPELFAVYFLIGLTGFGPAILTETKKTILKRKQWISEEEFLNGIALGQLLPGASFCSLTVYIGYRIRGVAGAITSFLAFLLPPFMVMTLLSYLYFRFGELPLVKVLIKGIVAIVVGLVANAIVEIGKTALKDIKAIIIALIALAIMIVYPNIFLILLVAALLGLLCYYSKLSSQGGAMTIINNQPRADMVKSRHFKEVLFLLFALALILYAGALQPILLQLGEVFFRMGALVFGNGFTVIPLIQQEVVTHYHWLSLDEFAVGLALGQITPGPILITSTFVGYKVAGFIGAVASTLGMFLPSLFLVILTAEVHKKVEHNSWVKAAFKGILASFVGMMVVVLAGLAQHALVDLITTAMAVLAFWALRYTKLNVLWIVSGGTLLYWLVTVLVN